MPKKKTDAAGTAEAKKGATRKRAGTTRKPARRPPTAEAAVTGGTSAAGRLRIKQVRSGIGHAYTYRRTLEALGLKYHQDEVVLRDHPSVRGMLHKVRDFVRVQPVEG